MNLNRHNIGFLIGGLVFTLVILSPLPMGMTAAGQKVMAEMLLMAIWWISEAMPLAVTALVPIVLFPSLGIMSTAEAAQPFAHYVNFLILGGFFLGITLEKWNLHRRIALSIILKTGTTPSSIMLGFMLASFVLSMWISNVATALMMVPIGLTVIDQIIKTPNQNETSYENVKQLKKKFSVGLMLAIAYAGNIGGMSTLIGTPCNAVLAGMVSETYGQDITFLDWFILAFPFAIVLLFLTWLYLSKVAFRINLSSDKRSGETIRTELRSLGPMSKEEWYILTIFSMAAICWVLRGVVQVESLHFVNDATISIFFGIILFVIPVDRKKRAFLLDWKTATKIPWGVLLLMGGGLSLAYGIKVTGLDLWVVSHLTIFEGASLYLIILVIVTLTVFLTELTSNVATITMLIPLLSNIALAMSVHPYALIIAVGISVSFAFMLPTATPGNSVVYRCQYVTVPKMARAGLVLNLLGMILIPLLILYYLPLVWGFDLSQLPEWVFGGID